MCPLPRALYFYARTRASKKPIFRAAWNAASKVLKIRTCSAPLRFRFKHSATSAPLRLFTCSSQRGAAAASSRAGKIRAVCKSPASNNRRSWSRRMGSFHVLRFCQCKTGFWAASIAQKVGFVGAGVRWWALLFNITAYYGRSHAKQHPKRYL